jgi:Cu/Ag efflux pump CusA
VQDVIDLALGGSPITGVFEGNRRFDVVARFAPEARVNPAAIAELPRARSRLAIIMPITLGVIFVLLFVTFGSAPDATLVLVTVPFSLAGGLVALYLRGMNLNVSAAVGFISLFGVAVMSGVLYRSEINRRRRTTPASFRDVMIEGSKVQLRPVLMVVIVAALGMVPAMLARGSAPTSSARWRRWWWAGSLRPWADAARAPGRLLAGRTLRSWGTARRPARTPRRQ